MTHSFKNWSILQSIQYREINIKTTREPVKKRKLQKPEDALRAPGLLVLYILRVLRKCVLCGERQGARRKRRRGEMC